MTTQSQEWWTVKEAAEHLRVSTQTVRQYIRQGRIASSQVTPRGRVLVSAASVEKLLERNRH